MRRLAVVSGIAAVITVTGVVRGQGKTDPTLNKMAADWAAAFNAKDAAKLASFYADDAVYMPPNYPMVKGRANLEAQFKREFEEGFTNLQLKPMESAISGSHAFEAGTATVEAPGGLTDNSKYLVVFKRVGSDWKIAYDIHNSDKPAAPSK
jgi:ketosteroid isomerase-like protein